MRVRPLHDVVTGHRYAVYGMSLISDMTFDFPPQTDVADKRSIVSFTCGTDRDFADVPESVTAIDGRLACHELSGGALYVRSSTLYDFVIDRSGRRVVYRRLRDGEPAILQNFLIGQPLSIAMVRQSLEPLHAAVVDAGGAFALLGDCSFGKSSLAASFIRKGHRLVTDDVLVAREQGGEVVALPGTGRIKLMPDSAAALFDESCRGVPLHAGSEKRAYRLDPHMVQLVETRLRAFFALPTPEERACCRHVEAEPLTSAELFHALVANTFVTIVDDRDRLCRNFASNARLATSIAGYRLRYPAGLDRLPDVQRVILSCIGQSEEVYR